MCRVCQSLKKIENIEDEGVDEELFSDLIFEVFTAQLSNGVEASVRVTSSPPLMGGSLCGRCIHCGAGRSVRGGQRHRCDVEQQETVL